MHIWTNSCQIYKWHIFWWCVIISVCALWEQYHRLSCSVYYSGISGHLIIGIALMGLCLYGYSLVISTGIRISGYPNPEYLPESEITYPSTWNYCTTVIPQIRKQRIKIDGHISDAFQLPSGVPQGSVLSSHLFTLYTTLLSTVISKLNGAHHIYADNTQIYLQLDSRNFNSSINELANCPEAIHWCGWEINSN